MRLGMFPGQAEALRELAKKGIEAEKRSRRQFILSVFATIGVGTGAYFAGRAAGGRGDDAVPVDDVRARWMKKLEWANEHATRPIEDLLAHRSTFLMTIEQTGGSDSTWRGYSRLAEHALKLEGEEGDALRRRLVLTVRTAPPPEWLGRLVSGLEQPR